MNIIQYVKNLFKSKKAKSAKADKPGAGLLPIGQYQVPFRLKASGILFPDGSLQTTACDGSGGGGSNGGGGDVNLDGLVTKEEFDDHEKRNAASFVFVEAEILRVTEEVVFNYIDITELHQEIVPEIKADVEGKASLSEENTFNAKQTFNKNVTFKGAETAIIPPLSSRWHKYSVNPPKNAEGQTDTSEAYGVNYYLDAGNSWKNQFKISNRNGTAFEVRGGSDMSGQLHSKWSYTGTQEEDNDIATVKYVKDAVGEGGGGSSTGYPALPEYDYYYLDLAGTSAGRVTLLDGDANRISNLNRVRLIGFSGVDKNGKRWARDKDVISYDRPFNGTANLLTEEGKVIMTVNGSGKATGIVTLAYFKDAIDGFCGPDTYAIDIPNTECITLPTSVSEISYPQKVYLHITGLHF